MIDDQNLFKRRLKSEVGNDQRRQKPAIDDQNSDAPLFPPHTECGTHTTHLTTHHMPRIFLEISADLGQWGFKTRWMEFLAGWLDAPNKSPPEMHPDS